MEKQISKRDARTLEDILDSYIEKHLRILWRRTRNPIIWLVRASILLVFL